MIDSSCMVHYNYKTLVRGYKHYELSNHLGNVLAVISDKRITLCTSSVVSGYEADVVSASDYYPFGMVMSSRSFSSPVYRYGFNGQEKDDEVAGEGNTNTAEYWEYDCRLGRRWNRDPKPYVDVSDYSCLGNNPILYLDRLGDKINLAELKKTDLETYNKLIADWSMITGYKLDVNEKGNLYIVKGEKPQTGSVTARWLLKVSIKIGKSVSVQTTTAGTGSDDKVIYFDKAQYENEKKGQHNVKGISIGMVLLHELYHWFSGQGDGKNKDLPNNYEKGPTVEFINKVEKEMGYDERQNYTWYSETAIYKEGSTTEIIRYDYDIYIFYDKETLEAKKSGIDITKDSKYKYQRTTKSEPVKPALKKGMR